MVRVIPALLAMFSLLIAVPAPAQQQGGFDLAGPALSVTVERGGVVLPITAVPALQAGDRLIAKAAFPDDQAARYMLIAAFLRGATNPPLKKWFSRAETWREKDNTLEIIVPEGAEQALLFLAPETGGGFDAVRDAVRGRPGVFVRAAQDLYQASLDHARLDAFVGAVGRIGDADPARLGSVAPVLAKSLGIKLNAECLSRPRALQATCLTQNRETLVLQAQRGTTLAETLTGTPVDLAYRIAATPEAGAGYYSPYIGLARDVARLFGAFRTAQYQYLPALSVSQGQQIHLKLNAAPSFQNPRSVLVAPLPPIGVAAPPRWQAGGQDSVCLARPEATLPLEDASLLYATGYARDLSLAVTGSDGATRRLPVTADAEAGGVRINARDGLPDLGSVTGAVLRGKWGFDDFSGPRLPGVLDAPGAWQARPDATVIVGREHKLTLHGGAAACVSQVALGAPEGANRSVAWKMTAPDQIETLLPLKAVRAGPLSLAVARYGADPPQTIALTGRVEASRIDGFTVHAGDRQGVLRGARLDQVAQLSVGSLRFTPGAITRDGDGDRLTMLAEAPVEQVPGAMDAAVTLKDGRTTRVRAAIAPPRPLARLISRKAAYQAPDGVLPIILPDALLPEGGRLDFSFRVENGPLRDGIEIATRDGTTARLDFKTGALQRIGEDVVVASVAPHALFGRSVAGPLRFRLLNDGAPGDWQPLAQVVRLPELTGLSCPGDTGECSLAGRELFLIAAIGDNAELTSSTKVPIGFVGATITVPRPAGGALFLRLHDALDAPVRMNLPGPQG
ncbi:hypothetical protein [Sphingomonas sp.]|uniref:hypothetical protein n=1 Tax=Sphingomonas sp. TaxID=28214 RepID=UPI002C5FDBDD|nr:hypothetical protein [Sphingomonas sp.]HTG38625.1 hypothetical protein [Sphingomonas sp.]